MRERPCMSGTVTQCLRCFPLLVREIRYCERTMTLDRTNSHSRELAFPVVVAVLVVGFSLPIALTSHPPIQDIPTHLAIVRTLAVERLDATWGEHFENRLRPDAYSAYYFACVALAKHVGSEAANRIVLTLYAVLLPMAFLALVLAYDPGRRWNVIPAFMFIYSDLYLVGLANYLLAMPMLFAGAAVGVRIARSESTSLPAILALAALGIALYLTHPFALAMLLIVLPVLILSRGLRRRLIVLGLGLSPGVILLLHRLPSSGVASGSVFWVSLGFKIRYLLTTPLLALDAHRHWSLYVVCGLGLLLVALVAYDLFRGARTSRRAGPEPWWHDRSLTAFALFGVLYFAAPFSYAHAIWFDLRLGVATWLLLLLAIKPRFTRGSLRRGLMVAMSAVSLLGVWSLHRSFDREIAPLFEVIEQMKPSSRVLPIVVNPVSRACQPFYSRDGVIRYYSPYAHFGAYYNVEKGGESPFMTFHATLGWIPLGLRGPFYERAFEIEDPFLPRRLLEGLPVTASHFDYILVRGLRPDVVHWVERFGAPAARAGAFQAFAVKTAAPAD